MARAGIYKSEVVKARNNLLAMGRYPSIDAIRGELCRRAFKFDHLCALNFDQV